MSNTTNKQELLEEYAQEKNLDFKFLLLVYLSLAVAFSVIIPKVYIKNQIYYVSRDIHRLYAQNSMLKEENAYLKQKLESIRFKNQVLDSVFINIKE
jgi:cell division protein FtsL